MAGDEEHAVEGGSLIVRIAFLLRVCVAFVV